MKKPKWLEGLTHKDWLLDGAPIRKPDVAFDHLDWSKAWVDLGPSIAGNLGPYWHVPWPEEGTVHRLYPKVLQTKWLLVIRQACREVEEKSDPDRLRAENQQLHIDLATAKIRIAELERKAAA